MLLPPPGHGAAIRAYIRRDTGAGSTAHLNRFPAQPFCTVTWFLSGTVHDGVSADAPALDAIVVGGPFTRPARTFSAGRIHAFTVVFFPDAFARLSGLAPASLADRLLPARDVLPAAWHAFLDDIAAAGDDGHRVARMSAFLAASGETAPTSQFNWLRRLREAAGFDRLCERQVERRIQQATGQSLRALRRAERLELALLDAREAAAHGTLHWATLAGASGYSDQPHLGRECRKLAGTAPAELVDRQARDESYWLFRCWR
ncbi:helix-turn-helix domain-containing protein [Pseudoduganella sp. SL102]|uniref:helix-turn-helix domain-containing protein n=1 Tax=Pseudoduganella sp. SL102 TaxID=2995154 RepID=UPI00248B0846|nr:helix-turn-helix domain-containing protein [Pseudoduganella sp. SL102]WBR99989.1 helix-turn-helix domain-containing protein [Pseudoduganella sp. SL102]